MSSVLVSGKVWLTSISKIELTKTLGLKIIILFVVQIKHKNMRLKNIARSTTDPEIDSVTWIELGNNMAPLILVANVATRWRHLH